MKKIHRCLISMCHGKTLPFNIACSISFADSPFIVFIYFIEKSYTYQKYDI